MKSLDMKSLDKGLFIYVWREVYDMDSLDKGLFVYFKGWY